MPRGAIVLRCSAQHPEPKERASTRWGPLSPDLAWSGGCGLKLWALVGALAAALTAQGAEVKCDPSVVFALCLPGGQGSRGKCSHPDPGHGAWNTDKGLLIGVFPGQLPGA